MYNNGPTNGGVNGWFIGQGQSYVVSDSFTGDGTNISGFVFAAWVEAGFSVRPWANTRHQIFV